MTQIGILSDTHGVLPNEVLSFFDTCDEIWHAGDIGNYTLLQLLEEWKPLRAVYGNIDAYQIRQTCPEIQRFTCEQVRVLMTHIGGYPSKYNSKILKFIDEEKPSLFISGHSHILRVMFDKNRNLLYINPGAAGIEGFHKVRTAVRFVIDQKEIKQLEIWEYKRR